MSYATMDHATWAENNINAQKSRRPRRANLTKGFDAAPEKLTPFHRRVFDILGIAFGGVYNAPITWGAIQWHGRGDAILVPICIDVATMDSNALTMLVFLCHEARIRLEIRSHSFHHLGLSFHQRCAEGSVMRRHPNLDEAVAEFRRYVPADHAAFYREPILKAAE